MFFRSAIRTNTFQHVVDTVEAESFGQFHHRCGDIGEAEGAVALLTMEMGVQVVHFAWARRTAYGILERACPVVNAMAEVVWQEEGEGAEDAWTVHCVEHGFQVGQRNGLPGLHHGFQYQ